MEGTRARWLVSLHRAKHFKTGDVIDQELARRGEERTWYWRRQRGKTLRKRTKNLVPSLRSCLGEVNKFARLVRHQSRMPESLVKALMIWLRFVIHVVSCRESPVLAGLKSPVISNNPSGCCCKKDPVFTCRCCKKARLSSAPQLVEWYTTATRIINTWRGRRCGRSFIHNDSISSVSKS